MKRYSLTLEILSPIHIGTEQEYDPSQYHIRNHMFYQFSFENFYEDLSADEQKTFLDLVETDNLLGIRDFIAEHFRPEQANYRVPVTERVARIYRDRYHTLENQLLIAPFIRDPGSYQPYIPGSTLKGAVRTGVISGLGLRSGYEKRALQNNAKNFEFLLLRAQSERGNRKRNEIRKDPFRGIQIVDIAGRDLPMMIGGIFNCARSRAGNSKLNMVSIQMWKEVLLGRLNGEAVTLQGELRYSDELFAKRAFHLKLELFDMLQMCNEFYQTELTREMEFYERNQDVLVLLEKIKREVIGRGQTLLRMGRFSGVYAVTVEKYRDPRPPGRRGWGNSRNLFAARYPMGWAKLSIS